MFTRTRLVSAAILCGFALTSCVTGAAYDAEPTNEQVPYKRDYAFDRSVLDRAAVPSGDVALALLFYAGEGRYKTIELQVAETHVQVTATRSGHRRIATALHFLRFVAVADPFYSAYIAYQWVMWRGGASNRPDSFGQREPDATRALRRFGEAELVRLRALCFERCIDPDAIPSPVSALQTPADLSDPGSGRSLGLGD